MSVWVGCQVPVNGVGVGREHCFNTVAACLPSRTTEASDGDFAGISASAFMDKTENASAIKGVR